VHYEFHIVADSNIVGGCEKTICVSLAHHTDVSRGEFRGNGKKLLGEMMISVENQSEKKLNERSLDFYL